VTNLSVLRRFIYHQIDRTIEKGSPIGQSDDTERRESGSMRKRPAWLIRLRVASALLVIVGAGVAAIYTLNRPAAPVADRVPLVLQQAARVDADRTLPKLQQAAGVDTDRTLPKLEQASGIDAPPALLRDFNVLLITMDTTRADHLRAYGHKGVETPNLDSLAQRGVLFSHAITPSPSTLPAHSSIHTGLYPFHHGARANGTFRLKDDVQTLAETFQAAGYQTGAAISASFGAVPSPSQPRSARHSRAVGVPVPPPTVPTMRLGRQTDA